MSLFKKMKKNIINSAILDLRNYSPQALMNIDEINSAITILPDVQDDAFYEAYSMIPVKHIASPIKAAPDKKFSNINGLSEITSVTQDDNTLYIVNGSVVVYGFDYDKTIDVLVNGMLVYDETCKVNTVIDNGLLCKADFVIKSAKLYADKVTLDAQFFENIDDSTVVCAGNKLFIDPDVNLDLLKSKKIMLASGNKIICSKEIVGYVTSISAVGNKITDYEEEAKHKSIYKTKNKYRNF